MALRILTYNILAGGEDRLALIASVIAGQQPDIVALQEARSLANVEKLAQKSGMSFTIGEAHNKYGDHVVWLSRLPVIEARNYDLPVLAKTLLGIKVEWDGAALSLFTTHLKSSQDQRSEQWRVAEVRAILGVLSASKSPLHVLVGDLNTIHPEDDIDEGEYIQFLRMRGELSPEPEFPRRVIPLLLEAGYGDCYRQMHPQQKGYTSHTTHPSFRVDYIFATPLLTQRLSACDVVATEEAKGASDHFPVTATFQ